MAENTEVRAAATDVLRAFLRPQERVLICDAAPSTLEAGIMAAELGADVVPGNGRHTWQDLLRQAFAQWVTVLIGQPKVILALAKIARVTGTPLPVRHVVLLGTTKQPWLLKGIRDCLDAQIHICNLPAPEEEDSLVQQLDEMLLSWASVLDYHVQRTEAGLRLEIVIFSGHPLPKLPSGAHVTVRPWNPGKDTPRVSFEG